MKTQKIINSTKCLLRVIATIFLIVILVFMVVCIYDYALFNRGAAIKLHLDVWDWFALIVAVVSLFFTVLTWRSQVQTKENTTRLCAKDYRNMLVSCYYNIVRNTINLYSLSECMKDKYSDYYPSEEYLQKLKLYLFDSSQISSQDIPHYYYGNFQRIDELCRYFNLHIDVTQKHLSSKVLGVDIKRRDMVSLISMHWLVASEIMKTIDYICPDDKYDNRNLVREQFMTIVRDFNPNAESPQDNGNLSYIGKSSIEFLASLFKDCQKEYGSTLEILNSAIEHHLGKRSDGCMRIPLIPIL